MAIGILDAPPELVEQVAKQLSKRSFFNFRRVSQYIQAATRHHLRIRFFHTRSITLDGVHLRRLLAMSVTSGLAKATVGLAFECHDDHLANRQSEKMQHAETYPPKAPSPHSVIDKIQLFRVLSHYISLRYVYLGPIQKYYESLAAYDGYNITNSFSSICAALAKHPARMTSITVHGDDRVGVTDVTALASMGRKLRTLRVLDITLLGASPDNITNGADSADGIHA